MRLTGKLTHDRRKYLLAASPVVGALVGAVTNVLTSEWNWWLFGTLVGLVTLAAIIVIIVDGGTRTSNSSRPSISTGASNREPAGVVPFQLPLVANFSGRDAEIATLLRAFGRRNKRLGCTVVALSGKGGVGKTALAVVVAHRLASRYQDGGLYVDLRGVGNQPVEGADALAGFLRALGVDPDAVPATLDERRNLFRSISASRRLLIVLDNAASAAQIRLLLPGGEGCAVIVTSRMPMGDLETSESLAVEVLPTADAVDFLTKVLGATHRR